MEVKFHAVGAPTMKKDAMALVTGKPVYTQDLAPKDCLVVKVLRSPHAHALIETVDKTRALKVPGIVTILTWEDVPHEKRFTLAGQTYPEPSPYDRYILDRRVRFVGDPVAIVAGETEEAVDKALKMLKVNYQVLEPVLDFHTAKDNPILVHPEEDWHLNFPTGADNKRNLCAHELDEHGDVDEVMKDSDVVLTRTYHTKANQQAMMETFRAYTYMDVYDRLNVVASTQVTFHVRRILAHALHTSKSKIRVIKPRIGGGFGAKQTVVMEMYPAIVTWKTGKPAMMIFSRYESMIASSPRHEMEVTVRIGANKDGTIRALDVYTLSNTGAYGEHSSTTVGLSGHKSIPLYRLEAHRFAYDVVYTNHMSAGAYRGYGATQGIFAVESIVDELAKELNVSSMTIRRDLMKLESGNMIERCHGGAVAKQEVAYETKQTSNKNSKEAIARKCVEFVHPQDSVFLDAGTTTCEIAKLIRDIPDIIIVTNDLEIAQVLKNSDAKVYICGGMVQKETGSLFGRYATEMLKDFRFDVGFFGAASINEEFQVTTPTHEKMWLKRQVPKQCARSYLAVDQSKFGKQSMTWINQLEDYTGVVTDREFLPEEVEVLKARRVRIIVV